MNIDLKQGSTGGNPGTTEPDNPDKPDAPDAPTNPDIPTGGTVVASGSCGAKGDNLTWTLDDNGLLTISGTGEMASDCIWEGVYYKYSIKYVWIKNGVTSIGADAFPLNRELMIVEIPDSVTSIGESAFQRCTHLQEITLPESITRIDKYAFSDCTSLRKITIPKNVKSLGEYSFAFCTGLVSAEIMDGVPEIGYAMFNGCTNLRSVTIPESVDVIRLYAFNNCASLSNVVIPKGVRSISDYAFSGCTNLESVSIPQSVLSIDTDAFSGCDSLKDVYYSGTKNEWNSIWTWDSDPLSAATIHCTDGDIVPNTENSITTGTASTSDSKFQATFADAKAGKEYVVLVSRSDSDPLNADNLIYINQITADADGELAVTFRTVAGEAEMTYVVACAQDDATVEPGQPDQPGEDKPSSGGDDGGAIILIGGVAAVAAVAGVVLMMPVKVEGTVKLADQPVANATVQVLKGDAVKAETVTDANGHFTVKVKRSGYTLRVQWTDASGQPVTRTVDFKAPNANLNVAA